jgi:dihydroorotate dehydrogenase (NAD+) catalytic subunit
VETVNERLSPGSIAAVEFNVSCHNVNFPFETILEDVLRNAVPASRHPVILKLSPDYDYIEHARMAARYGVAGLTAINAVKALRLDPRTGKPLLKNRYGSLSGRAIKPIGLRIVSELREASVRLPIIASAGIRDFNDCREFFWAGADAVSLGSSVWLKPMPLYVLGPLEGLRIRRLIDQVERYSIPERATPPIEFRALMAQPTQQETAEDSDVAEGGTPGPDVSELAGVAGR